MSVLKKLAERSRRIHAIRRGAAKRLSRKIQSVVCAAFLVFALAFSLPGRGNADSREYVLKAAVIYNFTFFINWPDEERLFGDGKNFNWCVAGEDPFGNILEAMARTEKAKNSAVVPKRISSDSSLADCHVLFISDSEIDRTQKYINKTADKPVLIIGDSRQFIAKGVGIALSVIDEQIKFSINNEKLEKKGFKVSSDLLDLAEIYNGGER